MKTEAAKRHQEMEVANTRLQRLLAAAELDKALLNGLTSGIVWARRAVAVP